MSADLRHVVVIPARFASSRLPGKPLIEVDGKTILRRTWERCVEAVPAELVYVATDSPEIEAHCRALGMQVVMTSERCLTGTDRIAEFAERIEAATYVNVQGDEPLIPPADIRAVVEAAARHPDDVINGFAAIESAEQHASPSIPKVVVRPDGRLLYMSRSPIPGNKARTFHWGWRQICVYAFPREALRQFAAAGSKTPLEEEEDIEILRFLELGREVRMIPLSNASIALDTPEDLIRIRRIIENGAVET
jgi:3-deoxy-manno-octulosonate cytidylyltransferase (CMP-KDO synthetase)